MFLRRMLLVCAGVVVFAGALLVVRGAAESIAQADVIEAAGPTAPHLRHEGTRFSLSQGVRVTYRLNDLDKYEQFGFTRVTWHLVPWRRIEFTK